jgi:tetratricopeptide (TPR) repeat protein
MWSRRSIEILIGATLLVAVSACAVTPKRAAQPARTAAAAAHQAAGAKPGPPPIPAAAQEEFDRALALARAGNDGAAQAQLASLARQYPQFCTPLVNLGILYRKSGSLDAAAHALQQAVARDPHSALAWTELGVTQRLGGRFQDAAQSYARAIAADPTYAPAYRDRGVLRDLYLDQPAAALGDFEQYRKLAGEDKPVVMWIAELQHRTGIKEPIGSERPATAAGVSAQPPAPATAAAAPQPQARN